MDRTGSAGHVLGRGDLFTQRDEEAVLLPFDRWDVEEVRENVDAILETLTSGPMPCYGAWSEENVAVVRRRDPGPRSSAECVPFVGAE